MEDCIVAQMGILQVCLTKTETSVTSAFVIWFWFHISVLAGSIHNNQDSDDRLPFANSGNPVMALVGAGNDILEFVIY